MTPGLDWRKEYSGWPVAAAKLAYCDRTMAALRDRDPVVTDVELDEDVGRHRVLAGPLLSGRGDRPRRGAARASTGRSARSSRTSARPTGAPGEPLAPAGALIRRLEPDLLANVFRWTGHFPERTRVLIRYLADRAEQLRQGYLPGREAAATVAVTTLVTGLAMNHVQRGSYLP